LVTSGSEVALVMRNQRMFVNLSPNSPWLKS